jgi:hypothetical protein
MTKACISLLFLAISIGCASSKISRPHEVSASPKLLRDAGVFVTLPVNGTFEGDEYPLSGKRTSDALADCFAQFARRVEQAKTVESAAESIQKAKTSNCDYLAVPTILHWEDRATEWSGKPDVISIRIELIDVVTGRTIDTVKLDAKSKWATMGGDHPQDLLPEPINEYVTGLYGRKRSK